MHGPQSRDAHHSRHHEESSHLTPGATRRPTNKSDAEIRKEIRDYIAGAFLPERQERVRSMVQRFSPRGQVEIARLLGYCEILGKVSEALNILEEFYSKYWSAQRLDKRGDPDAFPENKEYLAKARNRLGIQIPEPKK